MGAIPGSVAITGFIAPKDSADSYAVTDDKYNRGGYRPVSDLASRDNIPSDLRKEGMKVYVISEGKEYRLAGGIDNSNWEEVETQQTLALEKEYVASFPVARANKVYNQNNALNLIKQYAANFFQIRERSGITLTSNLFDSYYHDKVWINIIKTNNQGITVQMEEQLKFTTLEALFDYIDLHYVRYGDLLAEGIVKIEIWQIISHKGIPIFKKAYGMNAVMASCKGRGGYLNRQFDASEADAEVSKALIRLFKTYYSYTNVSDSDILKVMWPARDPRLVRTGRGVKFLEVNFETSSASANRYCYDTNNDQVLRCDHLTWPDIMRPIGEPAAMVKRSNSAGVDWSTDVITDTSVFNTLELNSVALVVRIKKQNDPVIAFMIRNIGTADTVVMESVDFNKYILEVVINKKDKSLNTKILTFGSEADLTHHQGFKPDFRFGKMICYPAYLTHTTGVADLQHNKHGDADEILFRLRDRLTGYVGPYSEFRLIRKQIKGISHKTAGYTWEIVRK